MDSTCSSPADQRQIADRATVAQVLVSKYADHLPLYRQPQIYARQGIDLDRSTLADWDKPPGTLRPLHERLTRSPISTRPETRDRSALDFARYSRQAMSLTPVKPTDLEMLIEMGLLEMRDDEPALTNAGLDVTICNPTL